jgi:hypothetical protein
MVRHWFGIGSEGMELSTGPIYRSYGVISHTTQRKKVHIWVGPCWDSNPGPSEHNVNSQNARPLRAVGFVL